MSGGRHAERHGGDAWIAEAVSRSGFDVEQEWLQGASKRRHIL
jgi:hypothetical protein